MNDCLKKILIFLSYILILIVILPIIIQSQNLLNQPESVTFDSKRNRYLVSNKFNGEIIAISESGVQSKFKTGLVSCRGIVIVNDQLFVASDLGVVGINLESAETTMTVAISGSRFLNDIAADSSGNLYVSDSQLSRIFRINISTQVYSAFVSSEVEGCNGLHFDHVQNRLLVCLSVFPGKIKSIDMRIQIVSTIIQTNMDQCDGLTEDNFGNYYISSWKENSVYRYNSAFSKPKELISSEHFGPADIYICKIKNILVVPNFNSNSIEFITVLPTHLKQPDRLIGTKLFQNYPNPFNPITSIKYELKSTSKVKIILSNIIGEIISVILDETQSAGVYECQFNANKIASGVYFYQLTTGNYTEKKKMILLK